MIGAAALAGAAAAALLWAAWPNRQRLAWALVAVAGVALYLLLRVLPTVAGLPRLGVSWNWSGHLLALAGMAALAIVLVRRVGLSQHEFGFACPASLRAAATVTVAALLLNAALNVLSGDPLDEVPAETWLFLATMPGLAEEIAFRGVLLAAAERAAPADRTVAGVRVGPGALALTLGFVALHGIGIGTLVSVLPAALLYLWLRLKTGSVLVPIVVHNLWNLMVLAAHL